MTIVEEKKEDAKASKSKLEYTVVKRGGRIVPFQPKRIERALLAAFCDTKKLQPSEQHEELRQSVRNVTELVVLEAERMASLGALLTVERIQDIVEIKLMETGNHDVARDYILYRNEHKVLREDSPRNLQIARRDGSIVRFNPMKIASAIERGFRDTESIQGPTPPKVVEDVNRLTESVVAKAQAKVKEGILLTVDGIGDLIEELFMQEGFFEVAKDFILYRAERSTAREEEPLAPETLHHEEGGESFTVTHLDGSQTQIHRAALNRRIAHAAKGFEESVSASALVDAAIANFYDGIKAAEVDLAVVMAARQKVEKDPAYSYVAARLLLDQIYRETMGIEASAKRLKARHASYFREMLSHAISVERLHPSLLSFDLDRLAEAMDLERDSQFTFLGLQTLYDRYLVHHEERRLETPQMFWMRVAMGLAANEGEEKNKRAIEFYNVLSRFLYCSATPTLFNSGTCHPQLSSCYLSTVMDDLPHIFKIISDDAMLSKWAGGLGNDWTNVRASGAKIRGTNGRSQGVIPFMKVANDTAVAVNQGGKRKGAMCGYLETWHLDIEDFLELRKNTGDERRRTHDMNTANWIPDLFLKRVMQKERWTLFSPNDVPDLHDLCGQAFENRYVEYEAMADQGLIPLHKRIDALDLWRKMLGMLFETGHPWITFKDPSNIRSPQDHVGVVHSSNLCTEILLNTSKDETAVCNLGSINLSAHTTKEGIDKELLASTVKTAIRMLDNVIDINFYPIPEAKNANARHRPIGLGVMGFQDALYTLGFSYASFEAVEFADESMELISYHALLSSSTLAKERGCYSSYKGSKWDRGILPIDSIAILKQERGEELVDMDTTTRLDWEPVRAHIQKHGMRNSNTMAIAPTATIANITGVTQSIEPMYKHLFVKSNLSGEFTQVNAALVESLKERGLWDHEMIDDLKYFDGSILEFERIPQDLKQLFLTAFEIEPDWIIECASRRQKWIDMGQSLNLYMAEPSGKKLNQMYLDAWKKGLKTCYYLRTLGATHIEKSTTDINKRGLQPSWMKNASPSSRVKVDRPAPSVCTLGEECESCQ